MYSMYNVIGLFDTIPSYKEQMKSDKNIQKCRVKKYMS